MTGPTTSGTFEGDVKGLIVKDSPGKGRGVFAARPFAAGELIERCPSLVLDGRHRQTYGRTVINNYHFEWGRDGSEAVALALGYGSLYNHSSTPNAESMNDIDANVVDFVAVRHIAAGEEIVINYGYAAERLPSWYAAS